MTDVISPDVWERHRRIVELRNHAEETFLALGAELYEFKRQRLFKAMGHPTFESYIADPDVDLTRSLAYRLIRIHEVFVDFYEYPTDGLLEAKATKLELIAPHVNSENIERLVNMAAATSRGDLRKNLRDEFGDDATPPLPFDYRKLAWLRKLAYIRLRRRWKGERS